MKYDFESSFVDAQKLPEGIEKIILLDTLAKLACAWPAYLQKNADHTYMLDKSWGFALEAWKFTQSSSRYSENVFADYRYRFELHLKDIDASGSRGFRHTSYYYYDPVKSLASRASRFC